MTDAAEVKVFLQKLGLSSYTHVLFAHGFDTVDRLAQLCIDDAKALRIKRGHARQIMHEIKYYGLRKQYMFSSPSVGGSCSRSSRDTFLPVSVQLPVPVQCEPAGLLTHGSTFGERSELQIILTVGVVRLLDDGCVVNIPADGLPFAADGDIGKLCIAKLKECARYDLNESHGERLARINPLSREVVDKLQEKRKTLPSSEQLIQIAATITKQCYKEIKEVVGPADAAVFDQSFTCIQNYSFLSDPTMLGRAMAEPKKTTSTLLTKVKHAIKTYVLLVVVHAVGTHTDRERLDQELSRVFDSWMLDPFEHHSDDSTRQQLRDLRSAIWQVFAKILGDVPGAVTSKSKALRSNGTFKVRKRKR